MALIKVGNNKLKLGIGIGPGYFNDLENIIESLQIGSRNWFKANDLLIKTLAHMHGSAAIKMSFGPRFSRHNPQRGAWQIPIRRVTESYVRAWKVKRVGMASYLVYNDSRAAYFIEFGIHPSPARIPRPVIRRTMKQTLKFIEQTKTIDRFAKGILGPKRGLGGRFIPWETAILGAAQSPIVHRMVPGGVGGANFRIYSL